MGRCRALHDLGGDKCYSGAMLCYCMPGELAYAQPFDSVEFICACSAYVYPQPCCVQVWLL